MLSTLYYFSYKWEIEKKPNEQKYPEGNRSFDLILRKAIQQQDGRQTLAPHPQQKQ